MLSLRRLCASVTDSDGFSVFSASPLPSEQHLVWPQIRAYIFAHQSPESGARALDGQGVLGGAVLRDAEQGQALRTPTVGKSGERRPTQASPDQWSEQVFADTTSLKTSRNHGLRGMLWAVQSSRE